MGHLFDVLLRVELIPLVKGPAQLRSGKTSESVPVSRNVHDAVLPFEGVYLL